MNEWILNELSGTAITRIEIPDEVSGTTALKPELTSRVFRFTNADFNSDGNSIHFSTSISNFFDEADRQDLVSNEFRNAPLSINLNTGETELLISDFEYAPEIPNLLDYSLLIQDVSVSNGNSTTAIQVSRAINVGISEREFVNSTEPSQVFVNYGDGWRLASTLDGITPGDDDSFVPFVTENGSKLHFSSSASSLQPGILPDLSKNEIFVQTEITPTSVFSPNTTNTNGDEFLEDMTPDGRFLVFETTDDLSFGPLPDGFGGVVGQIARFDTIKEEIDFIPLTLDGFTNQFGRFSESAISDNGRFVAYDSIEQANEFDSRGSGPLVTLDRDVFVRDMDTDEVFWVSSRADGTSGHAAGRSNFVEDIDISADGRFIVFESDQENLVDGDLNNSSDIFVRDMFTNTIQIVSRGFNGEQAFADIDDVSISPNGRFVMFVSGASNLVPGDTNLQSDLFIVDLDKLGLHEDILINAAGADLVEGTIYSDLITGDGVDNLLSGGDGDDTLKGEGGVDTAVMELGRADAAISRTAAGVEVVSSLGTDLLKDVEFIRFLDQTLDLASIPLSPSPEISVFGDGIDIIDGDTTPNSSDQTDFGSAEQGSAAVPRSFTIINEGTATLTLGTLNLPTGFSLVDPLPSALAPDASTTFQVLLDTSLVGTQSGEVFIFNDDEDENPFNFSITGTVTTSPPDDPMGPTAPTGPTQGDDTLLGTALNDTINALAGNDNVSGLAGDDLLLGGGGNDSIKGAAGDDRLRGNGGDDTLKGGGGADNLKGNGGVDVIRGNGGDDVIRAGGGVDNVKGGGGNDLILGGGGADQLNGGGGADTLKGNGGDDTLKGNGGADVFQFRTSDRNDTIADFRQGQDKIEIQNGVRTFEGLSIEQDGRDVLIGFGTGQVRVVTDTAAAFDESDFIF